MAQALPEKPSEESVWMDRAPVKCDHSVPKAVFSGDSQGVELDVSLADLQTTSHLDSSYSECVRLAMRQAEAQEYGLAEDDSGDDPIRIPDDILAEMGVSPDEIGQ